jgi:hypothetical protein
LSVEAIGSTDNKVQENTLQLKYCTVYGDWVFSLYFLKLAEHGKLLHVKDTGAEDIVACGPVARKRPRNNI